ncbi:MAG: ABC transporter ATP-binding protein [bacterium]|nr:MAG: ABC transporter ATP-binding protein [bacterium]
MDLFTLRDLRVRLGERDALDIPRLGLEEGRVIALTGPNGSGKTTLLKVLSNLLAPTSGTVLYRGRDLASLPPAQRDEVRRELGVVLQSPYLFRSTVEGNVSYGLARRGVPRAQRRTRARRALEIVGLSGFGRRPHWALSGGEAQRVALARALVLEPAVLLLDEPFANVDAVSRSVIERVLVQENRYQGTTVVFTTHDMEQAYRLADTVVTLFEGRVHEGSMENLFHGKVREGPEGPVFDTGTLVICVPPGREGALTAAVPPETILVSLSPISTSARNTLLGRVNGVRERNGTVDVTVDAGDTIVVRLTERSYREMDLKLGMQVYLIFKAEAVKL